MIVKPKFISINQLKSCLYRHSVPAIRRNPGAFSLPVLTLQRYYADKIVKVPNMAESISEGTLKTWAKQIGDYVEQDEEVVSIETDKVDVPVNAPFSGVIKEHFAKEEDTVSVGQDLFKIEEGGNKKEAKESAKPDEQETKKETTKTDVQENKKDSIKSEEQEESNQSSFKDKSQPKKPEKENNPESIKTQINFERTEHKVKINRMRKRIAERLKESQNTAASLTTFNEIDMSALMELRNKYKDVFLKKHGVKLGFMSAFVRASTVALEEIAAANATIEGDHIIYRNYVDISVAVSTPKGLVTPVLRNCGSMGFSQIEKNINELSIKARDNKITVEDMAGGTFTISNGGVFGSLMGTPILNLPQTAILGMHAIKERPVVINGQICVRPMMYVALTYDHRLIDGREAVTFLVRVKDIIEDPQRLLLDC